MKTSAIVIIVVFLTACGTSSPPAGPADAVIATFNALNAQDSAGLMESLSLDKRETYEANPLALHQLLDRWKGRHATVKILSVTNNDSIATILYDLTITGVNPKEHDSLRTRVYLEDGVWKHGY